jgi:hypothetical protein
MLNRRETRAILAIFWKGYETAVREVARPRGGAFACRHVRTFRLSNRARKPDGSRTLAKARHWRPRPRRRHQVVILGW